MTLGLPVHNHSSSTIFSAHTVSLFLTIPGLPYTNREKRLAGIIRLCVEFHVMDRELFYTRVFAFPLRTQTWESSESLSWAKFQFNSDFNPYWSLRVKRDLHLIISDDHRNHHPEWVHRWKSVIMKEYLEMSNNYHIKIEREEIWRMDQRINRGYILCYHYKNSPIKRAILFPLKTFSRPRFLIIWLRKQRRLGWGTSIVHIIFIDIIVIIIELILLSVPL